MLKTQNELKSSSETESMMFGVPTTMSASLLDQGKTILKFCLCAEVTPLIHGVQVLALHALKVLAPTS